MRTNNFLERIGAVTMPMAVSVIGKGESEPPALSSEGPPRAGFEAPLERRIFAEHAKFFEIPPKFCHTELAEGCYRLHFTPTATGRLALFGTRYRGTLRVERVGTGYRISGDLYRYSLLDLFVMTEGLALRRFGGDDISFADDFADDATATIPVYKRGDYHSYLEGKSAFMWGYGECRFSLNFDEWTYIHPSTGFSGTFDASPARSIRYSFEETDTEGLYSGDAYEGSTKIGTVSLRHVSKYFRRATLQVDTLEGAKTPPKSVPGPFAITEVFKPSLFSDGEEPILAKFVLEQLLFSQSFRTIFATAGWDLTVNFAGDTIPLPTSIEDLDPTDCTSWNTFPSTTGFENLHDLMESVAGYDPSELDTVWRAHLVAVPAELNCGRGVVFDFGLIDGVEREGAATFSHDGYPAGATCQGLASSFGAAADELQHQHPRAFLRSAAHEVGHTFNQIHQSSEGGIDNSIMTTTGCVGAVIGQAGGIFPDDIALSFNDTVRQHLIHMPDPAVRPGGMDFGAAVGVPEPADVNFPDDLSLDVALASDQVRLGEPLPITWTLRNDGDRALPAPTRIDAASLTARVSVTDSRGRTTFMRPVVFDPCTVVEVGELRPNKEVESETVVFYGRDGFAFEEPGRHTVNVVILWEVGGAQLAAQGGADVWVAYPLTDKDNQIAALMLDPEVGRAVATQQVRIFKEAEKRMKKVESLQKTHPAVHQIKRFGMI
jgi:hypothetical protein